MNENDSTSERPDADSLTGYIVTYKIILAAVTQHHFFKCQTCITLNKKKKKVKRILALTAYEIAN